MGPWTSSIGTCTPSSSPPTTSGGQAYPWRVPCPFQQKDGFITLDQLRTIDRERIRRKLGRLAPAALGATLVLLRELLAP